MNKEHYKTGVSRVNRNSTNLSLKSYKIIKNEEYKIAIKLSIYYVLLFRLKLLLMYRDEGEEWVGSLVRKQV